MHAQLDTRMCILTIRYVHAGECFCLLGANGAGKSTTIAMLACVLPPSAGDALMSGHSIRTREGRRHIRYAWNPITEVRSDTGVLHGYSFARALIAVELYANV